MWDAVGVGNAIMDALVVLDSDDLLAELGLTRGIMHPVGHSGWNEVYERVRHRDIRLESGGSCANSMSTMARLGSKVAFRGQVGDDELGRAYAERLADSGVAADLLVHPVIATGKCLSVVSPDAERTMITDLGAAVTLDSLDAFVDAVSSSRLLHVEGYTLLDGPLLGVATAAMRAAKAAGATISCDASDPFVIHSVRPRFWAVLQEMVDIVFLNAEEARGLTDHDPMHAAGVVEREAGVHTVVVKLGGRGSVVRVGGVDHHIAVDRVPAIDTTGAGDAYAGAFLYGWLNGWPPERCGRLASSIAAATVSQIGAVVKDNVRLHAIRDRCAAL